MPLAEIECNAILFSARGFFCLETKNEIKINPYKAAAGNSGDRRLFSVDGGVRVSDPQGRCADGADEGVRAGVAGACIFHSRGIFERNKKRSHIGKRALRTVSDASDDCI